MALAAAFLGQGELRVHELEVSGPVVVMNPHDTPPTHLPARPWTRDDLAQYLQCLDSDIETLVRTDVTFPPPRTFTFGERWDPALIVGWFAGRSTSSMVGPVPVPTPRSAVRHG